MQGDFTASRVPWCNSLVSLSSGPKSQGGFGEGEAGRVGGARLLDPHTVQIQGPEPCTGAGAQYAVITTNRQFSYA